ncbi:MAG: DUF3332 domain-containing protein [Bacteroidales bacterium]|nr:DUF3332 domain-containing protein [Bacteroidales bacterium]
MKRIKRTAIIALFLAWAAIQSGCIGSFRLTTNLYDWNRNVGGKAAQELVFLAFIILPVYGVTTFIDAVILNTIEFWGGANPVSMNEGESDVQIVQSGEETYRITATKHCYHLEALAGERAGDSCDLVWSPEEQAWYMEYHGDRSKLACLGADGMLMTFFRPDGRQINVNPGMVSRSAIEAAIHLETVTLPAL